MQKLNQQERYKDGVGQPIAISGGQVVVKVLEKENVKRVFCVPGESYLGVLDALYSHPSIQLISNRHENGASFMAEAYGKATGKVGVCMATRAVGASNLSIGLHTAMQDSTPVVALLGQVERGFRGREAFQELDLAAMFSHVCKWTVEINDVNRIPELLHRAFNVARSGRPGPVLVSLPHDMLEDTVSLEAGGRGVDALREGVTALSTSMVLPDPSDIEKAVEMINKASHPVLIAGGGVRNQPAADALVRFAEMFQLPVITAFRRFDVFPNSHPSYAGWLGFGPAPYLLQTIREADLVLAVGTRFSQVTTQDYRLLTPGQPLIHVDISLATFGKVYPPTLSIQSDSEQFLRSALKLKESATDVKRDREQKEIVKRSAYVKDLHDKYLAFSESSAVLGPIDAAEGKYVDLKRMMHDIQTLLAKEFIITSDAGNFFGWLVRYFKFEKLGSYLGPTSGAMGYGFPAGVAAKLAHPEKTVISFSGDGGFMMTMQELETAVRYRVPVVAIVVNNNLYGTIRAHQERHFPDRVIGTLLGNPDFARLAQTFGAWGRQVRTNEEFRATFKEALEVTNAAATPAVIEVFSNPDVLSVSAQR